MVFKYYLRLVTVLVSGVGDNNWGTIGGGVPVGTLGHLLNKKKQNYENAPFKMTSS